MKRLIWLLVMMIPSCVDRSGDVGWNPRDPENEQRLEMLGDSTIRFLSRNLRLRYDDGNILVSMSDSEIRFNDIENGDVAIYVFPGSDSESNGNLSINGFPVVVTQREILERDNENVWLRLFCSSGDTVEIVVTGMVRPAVVAEL